MVTAHAPTPASRGSASLYTAAVAQQQSNSRIEVNLDAAAGNLRALKAHVGAGVAVCGVVKKDGYGLGAVQLAHPLVRAGVEMLAVYSPEEAEELLAAAVTVPMLILMPVRTIDRTSGLYRHVAAGRLNFTVHDLDQLEGLAAAGRTLGLTLRVHLYLDTGMSRSGLAVEDLERAMERAEGDRHLTVAGVYSHLATADSEPEYAREQAGRFEAATRRFGPEAGLGVGVDRPLLHLANSYAAMRSREYHHDMIRPGLALLGYGAEALTDISEETALPKQQPVVRWMSDIQHVAEYVEGARVGYGGTHRLERASVLGTVPVGYGDGYPMGLSNVEAVVRVRVEEEGAWQEAAVLGRVNMDQLVVDLTDLKEICSPYNLRAATVEIYSDEPDAPNAVERLARLAGTHPYELLCRLSPRVARVYRQARGA